MSVLFVRQNSSILLECIFVNLSSSSSKASVNTELAHKLRKEEIEHAEAAAGND